LDEVLLAVAEPADTAARFSRLIGCVVVPDAAGGFALELSRGRVRLRPPDRDETIVPRVVGLSVRTSDGNTAIDRLVRERGIVARSDGGGRIVDAAAAGGVAIRFVS
jgi:hypothetical protein